MDGVGSADCAHPRLGEADVSHLSFGDQFGECPYGLLNGRIGIHPVLVVEIDVVRAESPQ